MSEGDGSSGGDGSSEATGELGASERAALKELADTLSVTGLVLMALAIVAILYAAVFIVSGARDPTPLVVTALCAPLVIAGFWIRSAAEPLTRIAEAKSPSTTALVSALSEFQRVFALQRTGFALALVAAVVGVVYQAAR